MFLVLALVAVIFAIGFWRGSTAPFLHKSGLTVHFDSAVEPLGLVLDFLKAVFVGLKKGSTVPIGVYFHGLCLALTAVFLVTAWS